VTPRQNLIGGGLAALLFFGALLWAGEKDPFSRKWFTLKTTDIGSVKCVTVLPKPMHQFPVVVYAHGWTGSLLTDGTALRQMAELGLATISLEYDQTNGAMSDAQLEALLRYLHRQGWANTNAIAWVGFSSGANRMLEFALQHPEQKPQLLVQLSGAGMPEGQDESRLKLLRCQVLLVHGEKDEVFPTADTKRLASILRTNGLPAELKIISDVPHDMALERGVVFRSIGEYCLTHLVGKDIWQNYHSIARWQAEAPPLWLFWLPAAMWVAGWFSWYSYRKAAPLERTKLSRSEIALRWLGVLLAMWALAITAVHVVTPHFSVNGTTLSLARRFLIQPKERGDFEHLAAQTIWQGEKLKTLLEHVELAGYNRELINWQLDDKLYRDYVLSPVITGNPDKQLNWRRPLWEEFYPRIRHESSTEDAAKIVVRHLRERVTIAALPNPPHDVSIIWLRQITDKTGFEIIYVAALRSVGVPARLDSQQQAEYWDGGKWQSAPQPSVISW